MAPVPAQGAELSALERRTVRDRPLWHAGCSARRRLDASWRAAMKIVVIGGSGLIGTKVVNRLRGGDREVVAASLPSGVNIITRPGGPRGTEGPHGAIGPA